MLPSYLVTNVDVRDAQRYEDYRRQVPPTIMQHGASYLCRGGRFEVMEGEGLYDRIIITKFPSWDHCRTWYHSKDYGPVKSIRQAASRGNMFMTEGLSGEFSAEPGAGLMLAMETIHDQETHEEYRKLVGPTVQAAGGVPLALGGRVARHEVASCQR